MGLGPVGIFTETGDGAGPSLHVLLVYPTLDKFAAAPLALEGDSEYQKAATEYLAAPKDSPAFDRIESWLMVAFPGEPQITPPEQSSRVLELRTYESRGEERARRKIEMFDDGEIPIFRACGFHPVFFGETLVGSGIPCLKYMLAAPDMDANKEGWKKFTSNADWLALKDQPKYADTVSKVSRQFLAPTTYSQVSPSPKSHPRYSRIPRFVRDDRGLRG